jgi:hypothetical protein
MYWVAQFAVRGGEARPESPWIGAYPDPGRAEYASDLYVLVTPAGPGSEEFCTELKDALAEVYHRDKVSLTGGLLRAVQSAHADLEEWNRRSLRDQKVAAGVSCLAAGEDGRACLAQVAPAAAVHYRPGRMEALRPALPEATEPIGLYDDLRPEFSMIELEPGDRLLLATPGLADALSPEEFRAVLSLEEEEVLPELYRRVRDLPQCAALLIAVVEGDGVVSGEW